MDADPGTSDVPACHPSLWHTVSDFTPLKAEALGFGALAKYFAILYHCRKPLLQKASFFFFFFGKFD